MTNDSMIDVPKETKDLMSRYLLGTATSVEQQALEDRYAADPEVFEQLVAVENELADRYARRELSAEEQTAFEQHVLAHPRRRARAEFAEALAAQFNQATPRAQQLAVSLTLNERWAQWWQSVLPAWGQPGWGMTLGLSAATLLLLLGGWWLFRMLREPDPGLVAQRNGTQVSPTPFSSPLATPTLAGTPDATPTAPVPAVPAFVTLTLNAGLVRGNEGDTPTLVIPPDTDEVRLRLKSEASGYARYRLTLQPANGRTVRTVITTAKANTFSLNVPARWLAEGEYVLALSGLNPDGEADALSKTIFRVSQK
jgi:hypothetical protein